MTSFRRLITIKAYMPRIKHDGVPIPAHHLILNMAVNICYKQKIYFLRVNNAMPPAMTPTAVAAMPIPITPSVVPRRVHKGNTAANKKYALKAITNI